MSGKSVLEKLRRQAAAAEGDAESQGAARAGWAAELNARGQASSPEVSVGEATKPEEIWGAAQLLSSREEGEEEGGGFLEALGGLAYMRALSSVSLRSPLTAVAVADGEVVGMAEVKVDGYVRNLAVDEGWRRKGVASRLLGWCAARAKKRGAERLWMHVALDNEVGIGFYRRIGFDFGPEEPFGPQREPGVRLSKPL